MFDAWLPIDRRCLDPSRIVQGDVRGAILVGRVVDVPGLFRSLRAQHTPRRAAEEMSWHLAAVLLPLVDAVQSHRGVVLGYAGDVATAFFPEDDGRRAVAAGLRAQAGLHKAALEEGRPIGEALTVGVSAGSLCRGAVGDPHRLIFDVALGAPIAEAHAAERVASPGQVVVSPHVRETLSSVVRCRPNAPEGCDVMALETLVREEPFETSQSLPSETVAPWVPSDVRDRLVTDGVHLLSESRQHATLFARLGGPSWVSTPGPDALKVLDARVRWLQEQLARHGGMVFNIVQDPRGVYAWAGMGAPTSRADDLRRAMGCALACRTLPAALGGGEIPVGLALDDVWSGAVGCRPRVQYAVLGEGVWEAVALMTAAEPGEVLVSEAVVRAEPGAVLTVGPEVDGRQSHRLERWDEQASGSRAFVGRRAELGRLDHALQDAQDGRGTTVVIEAAAGFGKSRLLAAFDDRLGEEVYVLRGAARELDTSNAYLVWRDMLEPVLAEAGGARAEETVLHLLGEESAYAALLNPILGLSFPETDETWGLEDEARGPAAHKLVVALMRGSLPPGPVVLQLEDLHWIDSASLSLLRQVREALPRLLMVITTRPMPEPVDAPEARLGTSVELIRLGGLGPDDVSELVRQLLGGRPDADVRRWLLARTEGHPYHTAELVQWLSERGLVVLHEGRVVAREPLDRETEALPPTIEAVLGERIDALPPREQTTLKVASVLGREIDYELLQSVLTAVSNAVEGEAREALDHLVSEGLLTTIALEPKPRWMFRHVLLRQAAYARLPHAWRRTLHGEVARWVESQRDVVGDNLHVMLAHHWERSGDTARAVALLDEAATLAWREGAHLEAIQLVDRANHIDPAPTPESTAHRFALLGRARFSRGELVGARQALEAALDTVGLGLPATPAGAWFKAFRELARQLFHRWVRVVARRKDPAWAAWEADVLNELTPIYYLAQAPAHFILSLVASLNTAEEARDAAGAPGIRVEGFGNMTIVCSSLLLRGAAERYRERAVREARELNDPVPLSRVLSNTGIYLSSIGRLELASTYLDEALALQRRVSRTRRFEVMAGLYGWALQQRGLYTQAEDLWTQGMESAQQRGDQQSEGLCTMGRSVCLLHRLGDEILPEVVELHRRLEDIVMPGADPVADMHAHAQRALVALRQRAPDACRVHLRRALEVLEGHQPVAGYAAAAYALTVEGWVDLMEATGDLGLLPEARRALRRLRSYAVGQSVARVDVGLIRGRLALAVGATGRASGHLRRALAQAESSDMRRHVAWIHWHLARCADEPDEQAAHLDAARGGLSALGLRGDEALMRLFETRRIQISG